MVSYLRGLLAEAERKNGWTLAEMVGETGPQGMQWLLNFYAWGREACVMMCVMMWSRCSGTPNAVC